MPPTPTSATPFPHDSSLAPHVTVKEEADAASDETHFHHRKSHHASPTSLASEVDRLRRDVELLEQARKMERRRNQELEQKVQALQAQLASTHLNGQVDRPSSTAPLSASSPSPHPISGPPPAAGGQPPAPQGAAVRDESAGAAAAAAVAGAASANGGSAVKDEPEVSATRNMEGRSSCHRCKSTKDNQLLMFCTNRGEEGSKKKKKCGKKYCISWSETLRRTSPYAADPLCRPSGR